jgi:uncharacterized membrane protein
MCAINSGMSDEIARSQSPAPTPPPTPHLESAAGVPALPDSWQKRIPQKAHPLARQLLDLSAKDRAKVLKAFGKEPLPADQLKQQMVMAYSQTQIWQGPIPPASELAKFNEVAPGSAAQLIQMAVNQQNHRMGLENYVVTGQMKQSGRGQVFAFILGVLGLASGFTLVLLGHSAAGSVIGSGGIFALAATFVTGRWQEKRDRDAKNIIGPAPAGPQTEGGQPAPISSENREQGTLQI